jgi:hypothetical protein
MNTMIVGAVAVGAAAMLAICSATEGAAEPPFIVPL